MESAQPDASQRLALSIPSLFALMYQVPGEANPINMVAKLSQLTSLLSSIEDKVCGGPCSFPGLLYGPLFAWRMPRYPCDSVPTCTAFPSPPSLKGPVRFCPQVKALLHEGPESSHWRSLIPPVTFEVSGCGLVLHRRGLGAVLVPGEGGLLMDPQSFLRREPNGWAEIDGQRNQLPGKMIKPSNGCPDEPVEPSPGGGSQGRSFSLAQDAKTSSFSKWGQ